jgi:hypothetical protein
MEPVSILKYPGSQASHSEAPAVSAKLPLEQAEHSDVPDVLAKLPATHIVHGEVEPDSRLYSPGVQNMQEDWPSESP